MKNHTRREFLSHSALWLSAAGLSGGMARAAVPPAAEGAPRTGLPVAAGPEAAVSPGEISRVLAYIRGAWDSSVRSHAKEPYLRPVPVPHTVGSPLGKFKALFYWDTYYTNLGLLRQGRVDLAQSNCEAFAWLVDQIGYVPNSVFVGDNLRSQPPYFSQMVREVYEQTGDRGWLAGLLPRLEREYQWWDTKRACGDGLNRHGQDYDAKYLLGFYDQTAVTRLKMPATAPETVKLEVAGQLVAEAESGWDFTPVFDHRCTHFAPVHLNTLLWKMEDNLAFFCGETARPGGEAAAWAARRGARAELIHARLWSHSRGLFMNWDYVHRRHGRVAAADTFAPLVFGLATPEEAAAVRANLPRFECACGLACTEDNPDAGKFQWSYPVAWPPLTWLAISGLARYGYQDDARRLARKYLRTMANFHQRDGGLWEKYDARTGEPNQDEYAADPMLGWSAGVFVAAAELLRR
jgi:alpha,alpha-trehalase